MVAPDRGHRGPAPSGSVRVLVAHGVAMRRTRLAVLSFAASLVPLPLWPLSLGLLSFAVPAAAQKPAPDLFAAGKAARAEGRFGMLLRQFRADEPALPERHEAGVKPAMAGYQGHKDLPAGHWVWVKPYWFVFRDGPDATPQNRQWGPEQACGAPDTREAADRATAWATLEQDTAGEWLLLEYSAPVRVVRIDVHENWCPGALAALAILTPQGEEIELWRHAEPKAPAEPGRVLQLDVPVGFVVERVLLRFASEKVPGWNEVDAVGLLDDKGKQHWANRAEASSTYAVQLEQQAAGGALVVAPAGGGLQRAPLAVDALPAVELPRVRIVVSPERAAPDVPAAAEVAPAAAEITQLRARIAELEAQVKRLEAELQRERGKAGR